MIGGLARTFSADHDVDAVIAEDALEQRHIGEPRYIFQDQSLIGEEARDHQRQRRVLRPGDRNSAVQAAAANDANAIHAHPRRSVADRSHHKPIWRSLIELLVYSPG